MNMKNYRSKATVRILLNLLSDPAAIVDEKGNFLTVNDAFQEVTGLNGKELVGTPILKLNIVSPESKAVLLENLKNRLQGVHVESYEVCFTAKTGETRWVEVTGKIVSYGEQPASLVVFHDVTDRKKKAEEEIRFSEEKYKNLFENAPDVIVTVDLTGKITSVNKAIIQHGFKENDIVGNSIFSVIPVEYTQKMLTEFKKMAVGNPIQGEIEILTPFGKRNAEYNSNPIWLSGKVVGSQTIIRDVTELKKAEAQLQEQLRMLDLAHVIAMNMKDEIIFWNSGAQKMYGFSGKEALGKSPHELLKTKFPKPIEKIKEELLRTGKWEGELVHKKADGTPIFVASHWALHKHNNKPVTIIEVNNDITELKKAEEKTQQQNAVLAGVSKIFQETMSARTQEDLGQVCLGVAKEITQSKLGFITEIKDKDLVDIAISNPGWDSCKIINSGGNRQHGTFKIHGVYGRVISDGKGFFTNDPESHPDSIGLPQGHPPLKAFLGVPLICEGRTIGIIAVGNREGGYTNKQLESLEALALAIVEALLRKRSEEALQKSEDVLAQYSTHLEDMVKEKTVSLEQAQAKIVSSERLAAIGELASMVGHDLRNPLAGIKNATYILKKKGTTIPEAQAKEMLEIIDKSIDHSDKIINDLLDYARDMHLELTKYKAHTLVDEAARMIEVPDRIRIINRVQEGTWVWVNADKMSRVFINLIKNAVDAMPQKGTLEISSCQTKDRVEIAFADTGTGIPEETLKKLFTPLVTTKAQGMGFGLAICKRIIEAHEGTIKAETEVNKGTIFTITLPVKPKVEVGGERTWINMPESLLSTTTKT